ncbi:hypothetical protein IH575_01855 [Candidatus Dojkabacteria bacterium]|nr:hypothetical protein [Candidatus Dojkabacteria bacterium]
MSQFNKDGVRMLTFVNGSSKIKGLAEYLSIARKHVWSFGIPAGYTCPKASLCQSYANPKTGKITDGKDCQFRCYAASLEARYPNSRKNHWDNYNNLLYTDDIYRLIMRSIPKHAKIIRIHSSGDFYSKEYFLAWCEVARMRPDITFFGYTKVLDYVDYEKPKNFTLTYSMGGKDDHLYSGQPACKVVKSESAAARINIPVSCIAHKSDDYDYIMRKESFAIVIHGTQPKKKVTTK